MADHLRLRGVFARAWLAGVLGLCLFTGLFTGPVRSWAGEVTGLQKPVIPTTRIAELREELARLGFGVKPFDDVVQAVVDSGNAELAFRLLLDGPEFSVESAAESGQLARLKLLHLAEQTGYGPLVTWFSHNSAHSAIIMAIFGRHPEVVEFLIRHWAVHPERAGWMPDAAQHNLPQTVELLLELYGQEPWLKEQIADTLMNAVDADCRPVVIRMLELGADLNAQGRGYHCNAFQLAVWNSHPELAQLLLGRGAKIDVCTAAALGRLDQVKRLADEPVPENYRRSNRPQPLFWAAAEGKLDCLKYLLEQGADVNAVAVNGWTSLHMAVYSDDLSTVGALLDHGANPLALRENYHNHHEHLTPLHFAAEKGKVEMVQLFLERGVSPWVRGVETTFLSQGGSQPVEEGIPGPSVFAIAEREKQPAVVEALIRAGLAEVRAEPKKYAGLEGDTLFSAAASIGDLELCRTLLAAGARIEGGESVTDASPLEAAAAAGQTKVVQWLLDSGAKVDGAGRDTSRTPLHAAARAGQLETARQLLDAGATIDPRRPADEQTATRTYVNFQVQSAAMLPGKRPLTLAVEGEHPDVVKLLLVRGALPDIERTEPQPEFLKHMGEVHHVSGRGKTPLEVALKPKSLRQNQEHERRETQSARWLLKAGSRLDPNARDSERLVHDILWVGDVERLELIEQAGVTAPQLTYDNVAHAIHQGRRQMVQALLARGFDPAKPRSVHEPERHAFREVSRTGQTLMLAAMIEACPDRLLPIRYESDAPPSFKESSGSDELPNYATLFRVYGAKPLQKNNHWLLEAVRRGNAQQVEDFLKQDYDPNEAYEKQYPLSVAVEANDLDIAKLLFRYGASMDRLPHGSRGLLIQACHSRHADPEMVELLMDQGADPSEVDPKHGGTPVHAALRNQRVALARRMLERKPWDDLFLAAGLGDVEALNRVLDSTDDQLGKRSSGLTALDWAIETGQRSTAELLMKQGAKLENPEQRFVAAVVSRNPQFLDWLLGAVDQQVITEAILLKALHTAIEYRPQPEMVRVLCAHGAKPSREPKLLVRAAYHGNIEIIETLVEAGASVNATVEDNRQKISPLSRAIRALNGFTFSYQNRRASEAERKAAMKAERDAHRARQIAAAIRLLELGADPRKNSTGVLHAAVNTRSLPLVRKLLEADADPNDRRAEYPTGDTALHAAVELHDPRYVRDPESAQAAAEMLEIVDLLLEHGADPRLTSSNQVGRTPLDDAENNEDDVLLKRLNAATQKAFRKDP